LIGVHASSQSKYTTSLMKILFTDNERANGYIIEGNSSSKRTALDKDRVELLKRAIKIKFRISDLDWEKEWAVMKNKSSLFIFMKI